MSKVLPSNVTPHPSSSYGLGFNQDVDADGAIDPTLESSLIVNTEDAVANDDEESSDLEVGHFIPEVRNLGADNGEADPELDTGAWLTELVEAPADVDLDGPVSDSAFVADIPESTLYDGEPDDDADSGHETFETGKFPTLDLESELQDDAAPESYEDAPIDANDLDVAWSAQPWCEYGLPRAFVPRVGLVAQGDAVMATGDATDTLSLEDFSVIDSTTPPGKTRRATFLDDDARRSIIVSVTGQVKVWDRKRTDFDTGESAKYSAVDRAMDVWKEPNSGAIWLRSATGELFVRRNNSEIEPVRATGRCLAMGGSDKSLVCLLNQSHRLSLMTIDSTGSRTTLLPREMGELADAESISLATLGSVVALGSRGHGLWLSSDGGITIRKVAGCRNITACAIGPFAGRVHAWAALFFELDDRSELVDVDCKGLRIHKLTEYKVVSDSSGPEDDPPERARIDDLLWDPLRQRILAAGCFGLTCFVPPHDTYVKS